MIFSRARQPLGQSDRAGDGDQQTGTDQGGKPSPFPKMGQPQVIERGANNDPAEFPSTGAPGVNEMNFIERGIGFKTGDLIGRLIQLGCSAQKDPVQPGSDASIMAGNAFDFKGKVFWVSAQEYIPT